MAPAAGAASASGPGAGLVSEFRRCVRAVSVSSRENNANRLMEDVSGYWQSSGTHGKHWIRLEMQPGVLVQQLQMLVCAEDGSYMPHLIVVSAGAQLTSLRQLAVVTVAPHETWLTLLYDLTDYYPYVEIAVRECREGGIDCRIHALRVVGRTRTEEDRTSNTVAFLASDGEEQEVDTVSANPSARAPFRRPAGLPSGGTALQIRVFVWGLNDKDQLGGLKGSKIKLPVSSESLSKLQPLQIVGGSKCTFIVSHDGRVYACGEGKNGRLGLGHCIITSAPRQMSALSQYVVKKVAVNSGGRHALALTADGKVFSWGEGDDGKLGHGNRQACFKPRQIEALRSRRIRDISAGSSHSAAITSCGQLYTWGLGEYGRLGHGDNQTQLTPKLVEALAGHRVVQVACGSRDAQTLALTDKGLVFSWGDGDFGKLGRGGSEGCSVPQNIERLNGLEVIQIECGAQFSLALTRTGQVWTWGKGDYYRLGHGTDQHVRRPSLVEALRPYRVIHVGVGALHCLAVTDTGQVFAWGDNDHGQQGNGTTQVNRKPTSVHGLEGVKVSRVACGSSHSVAWTTAEPSTSTQHEPVLFPSVRDPLGTEALSLSADCRAELKDLCTSGGAGPARPSSRSRPRQVSLARSLLQMDSAAGQKMALDHLLRALAVMSARDAVLAAVVPTAGTIKQTRSADTSLSAGMEGGCVSECDPGAEVPAPSSSGSASSPSAPSVSAGPTTPDIAIGGGEAPALLLEPAPQQLTVVPDTPDSGQAPATSSSSSPVTSSGPSADGGALTLSSRMSQAAITVLAATLTAPEQAQTPRTPEPQLDSFTARLTADDARSLVDLLKLSAAGRTRAGATAALASLLRAMGRCQPAVSAMLLETCVTELEDVASGGGSQMQLPPPVVQESPQPCHPYLADTNLSGHVRIPGAESLWVDFDPQCSTERRRDLLTITDAAGRVVSVRSGRDPADWSAELRVPGCELRWKFVSDLGCTNWRWKFTVHPVLAAGTGPTAGPGDSSDRRILSRPSLDLVRHLLEVDAARDPVTVSRLTAALACCAQLSSLLPAERRWALSQLRRLLASRQQQQEPAGGPLAVLVKALPEALSRQHEYEEPQVRAGKQLMHSDFFKELVALACELGFDQLPGIGDNHRWTWFRRYCLTSRVMAALVSRQSLPSQFLDEVGKKIRELSGEEVEDTRHADHSVFTEDRDDQLLQWIHRRPEDWTLSWGSAGVIYAWGHNHRGQLGGLDGAKVKQPTPCEAFSLLKPVQLVGGEQTLFAVTGDGKVFATGYGSGGRLGVGGTDSVSTPTLLESIQHVFIKKVAVNSGGKHCLALTVDGEVYSWGEGDDGKLGHATKALVSVRV